MQTYLTSCSCGNDRVLSSSWRKDSSQRLPNQVNMLKVDASWWPRIHFLPVSNTYLLFIVYLDEATVYLHFHEKLNNHVIKTARLGIETSTPANTDLLTFKRCHSRFAMPLHVYIFHISPPVEIK